MKNKHRHLDEMAEKSRAPKTSFRKKPMVVMDDAEAGHCGPHWNPQQPVMDDDDCAVPKQKPIPPLAPEPDSVAAQVLIRGLPEKLDRTEMAYVLVQEIPEARRLELLKRFEFI